VAFGTNQKASEGSRDESPGRIRRSVKIASNPPVSAWWYCRSKRQK